MGMTRRFSMDGKYVSLLGYGAMRLPTVDGGHACDWTGGASPGDIDQELLNRQIAKLLEGGVNYFDTSPAYCRGKSEACLGAALAKSGYDRGSYFIATKLSNFTPAAYSLDACRKMFADSLRYLRTDYVDCYLLHSVGNGGMETFRKRYLDNGALDWCCEQRAKKTIRNLGFSYHGDPKTFEWCLENHDRYKWDFCQIQLNYVDWRHAKEVNDRNLDARYLYDELCRRKIPIVVMEPLLGGRLARYNYALAKELMPLDPSGTLAKWAFRFCGGLPGVMTVLSGMTRTNDIEENLATFSPLKACSPDELEALERAAVAMLTLNTVPCNRCDYCMPCPYGLDIPAILSFRNEILSAQVKPSPRETLRRYAKAVPEELRRADHCTGCGRCKPHCPQQIDVPVEIAAIDKWIDEVKNEAL